MEIHKCDRCRCLIEGYEPILFHGANQNEVEQEGMTPFGLLKRYTNETWELCTNCALEVLRWLAHQENELKEVKNET